MTRSGFSIRSVPLLAYSGVRSVNYTLQFTALNSFAKFLPWAKPKAPKPNLSVRLTARKALLEILRSDVTNIERGYYPASVLWPESPMEHVKRIPAIIGEGFSIYRRRWKGRTTQFDRKAHEFLDRVQRYYRRNFHFQTDGYLSARSARLYEHQVELLFNGAADAMRRLVIPPMKKAFRSSDGEGLTFLEIGAGTGRTTRFVHQAFPKAKIIATDLSEPYLKEAEKKLMRYPHIDYVQADGAKLPFQDGIFDAVYSVFLFHELPLDARKAVIAGSCRVLKKGGFFGYVDSLQKGDVPEFDELLAGFPVDFHEPFYRNYTEHSMQTLLRAAKLKHLQEGHGFMSKVGWAKKGTA